MATKMMMQWVSCAAPVGGMAAADIHRQVHAGGAGVITLAYLHQLAYLDGAQEADAPT